MLYSLASVPVRTAISALTGFGVYPAPAFGAEHFAAWVDG